eukprot:CAMPEP_0203739520 /NCGR_PEP_ID=MMETSP0092-20131115/46408_1 /ASSEMBLY_ACC=CAM_ASM_001090 /TAXON_ID=426623 /ORGANISM="Chaetoceros affinis, Strain CCMP159" /LENGTH=78 /DNA_ID=CAMNT_0050625637 /DNA_START=99 /DNA_END=332 /DNA_ORIENTATION=-
MVHPHRYHLTTQLVKAITTMLAVEVDTTDLLDISAAAGDPAILVRAEGAAGTIVNTITNIILTLEGAVRVAVVVPPSD